MSAFARNVTVRCDPYPCAMSHNRIWRVIHNGTVIAERISPISQTEAESLAWAHLHPVPRVLDFRPKAGRPRADARGRGERDDFGPEAA